MSRTFAFGAALAQGSWPCQEDGYYVDPSRRLFAVADGFGGRGAGDLAAKLALAALAGRLEGGGEAALARAFVAANKQILDRNAGRAPAARGGASLVAGLADPQGYVSLLHTGAVTALLLRQGEILTVLAPQAAPRVEFQPALPTEALGLGEALRCEAREFYLQPGDLLLLASGGVDGESAAFRANLAAKSATWSPLENPESLVRALVEEASMSAQGWNRTLVAFGRG